MNNMNDKNNQQSVPLIDIIKLNPGIEAALGCKNCFQKPDTAGGYAQSYLPNTGIRHCAICNECMTWYSTRPVYYNNSEYYCCSTPCLNRFRNAIIVKSS